jgi:DnaJ-class molecular chaperone
MGKGPCPQCGKVGGHLSGCPSLDKTKSKNKDKGIMKGRRPRICFSCKGTGMIGKKVCPMCHGTGERN